MKRYLFLPFIMVLMSLSAASATERYEIERELPLYFEQLRQELQYPDAWGNSEMTDYNEWREYARDILLQRLQYTPDDTPYDYRVIATEQRAGYKAHRIELNINAMCAYRPICLSPTVRESIRLWCCCTTTVPNLISEKRKIFAPLLPILPPLP
ncbi:MAG: hypothetical protein IKM10_05550 [Bacteroidaceae bacterium]|nr:hypothetical protein [Bacteroidaceae bacterium]